MPVKMVLRSLQLFVAFLSCVGCHAALKPSPKGGLEDVWQRGNCTVPRAYFLDCPWKTLNAYETLKYTGFQLVYLGERKEDWEQPLKQLQLLHGFIEADEIVIDPATRPDTAESAVGWGGKFSREHRHPEDEVRFLTDGGVIWDIRSLGGAPHNDTWLRVHVYAGEAAIIPKKVWHRMFLHKDPPKARITRIYKDTLGWQADYRDELKAGDDSEHEKEGDGTIRVQPLHEEL